MNISEQNLYRGRIKDSDETIIGRLTEDATDSGSCKLVVEQTYEVVPETIKKFTGYASVAGDKVFVDDIIHFKDCLCGVLFKDGEYIANFEDLEVPQMPLAEAINQYGSILEVEHASAAYLISLKHLKPGQSFTYLGQTWVVLEHKKSGATFVLSKKPILRVNFDRCSNNWYTSMLRRFLNQGFWDPVLKLSLSQEAQGGTVRDSILRARGFIEFTSTLTTDDGCRGYGSSKDFAAPLAANYYRRYRNILNRCGFEGWLLTAQTATDANNYVGCVNSQGIIDYVDCNISKTLYPMCCLKGDTQVLAGSYEELEGH